MKKIVLAVLVLLILFLALSCSSETMELCSVSFASFEENHSKTITVTQMTNKVMAGPDLTEDSFRYYVKFQAASNGARYSNHTENEWHALEDLGDLILSQGNWKFWAKALSTKDLEGNSLSLELYATPEAKPSETYISLANHVIYIPMVISSASSTKGSVKVDYTVPTGYSAEYSFFLKNGDTLTPVSATGNTVNPADPGNYVALITVKDENGNAVFTDMKFFPVIAGQTVVVDSGKYSTENVHGISTQEGTTTGIEDALDGNDEEKIILEISPDLAENLNIKGTDDPQKPEDRKSPLFEINNDTDDITLKMSDKTMFLEADTFKLTDCLFHVDGGKTVRLENGIVSNNDVNGQNKAEIGPVIELDGGSLYMNDMQFYGSRSNKSVAGAIVFAGHDKMDPTARKGVTEGGVVVLENSLINGAGCIYNYYYTLDASGRNVFTEAVLKTGGVIDITIKNCTLTHNNNVNSPKAPITLTNNYNNCTLNITLKGKNDLTPVGKYVMDFTGSTNAKINIYYTEQNAKYISMVNVPFGGNPINYVLIPEDAE